jgi:molybdopterin-guanine dinucleotide biosynthesis protein A
MLTIAILAGGKSQRMGRDKAFLPFLGKPLIRRVMDRVAELADDLLIVAPRTEEYLALGVRLMPDLFPGRGSLGGLYTALVAAVYPIVAVVPCDAPFINPALFIHECDILVSRDFDAVVPSSPDGTEPLHAVYWKEACLSPVRTALDAGLQKLIVWYPQARVHILSVTETSPFDPQRRIFQNVNTPEDYLKAEKLAKEE